MNKYIGIFITGVLAEWIGYMIVPELGLYFYNMTRLDKNEEFKIEGYLCFNPICLYPPILLHHNESSSQLHKRIQEISPKAIISFSNSTTESYPHTLPIFHLKESLYSNLIQYSTVFSSLKVDIFYQYDYHCERTNHLQSFYSVLALSWTFALVLWAINTYYINFNHSKSYQRASTTVIIFKIFSVVCAVWYWSCPFDTSAGQIVSLLKAQCLSLYQTTLMCFHLFLAQGVYMLDDSVTRRTASYSMLIMLLTYIFACSSNLLGSSLKIASVSILVLIMAHVGYFSWRTFRKVQLQLQNALDVGSISLTSVAKQKIYMFSIVSVLQVLYFVGAMGMSLINDEDSVMEIRKEKAVHGYRLIIVESYEFVLACCLFYVLRARMMNQYFFTDISHRGNSVLPFYRAESETSVGEIALIETPRKFVIGINVK
ncbi:hypothetical protein SteCoe_16250 [Stentor coeruleus]|uniref:Uncharacterized protein n=1 Tax=Stentor coeruleus TaxID=5963 RepID=A0A1R2C1U0_9CILI|nr:hypothetical protein SteCoe_16250 [Stentor coeruleus]